MKDIFLLCMAADDDLLRRLVRDLETLGVTHFSIDAVAKDAAGTIHTRLMAHLQQARFGAVLVSRKFPLIAWPTLEPDALEAIVDRVVFIRHGVPAPSLRRVCSGADRFETIESRDDATNVAHHLVSILKADPETHFTHEEPIRRQKEAIRYAVASFVRHELGILPQQAFAQIALMVGTANWTKAMGEATRVTGDRVRSVRAALTALDDDSAVAAIAEALQSGRPVEEVAARPTPVLSIPGVPTPMPANVENADGVNLVATGRQMRIFVSSTFRDMHAERDLLGRFVFPQLREYCRRTGIDVFEIDLRWGVTDEEIEQGELLNRCLSEIDSASPIFVVVLGDRYGYIPETIDKRSEQRWPFLRTVAGKSIMDIEVTYGALRQGTSPLFFARLPWYGESVAASEQERFLENDEGRQRLADLKGRIRAAGQTLIEYVTPEEFAWLALPRLKAMIEAGGTTYRRVAPDRTQREQGQFIEDVTVDTIQRVEHLNRIDKHVSTSAEPLAITGESGIGKTVLLAQWVRHRSTAFPEQFVVFYSSQDSSAFTVDWQVLTGVMDEVAKGLGLADFRPSRSDVSAQLDEMISEWKRRFRRSDRPIIVLDAPDRLRYGFTSKSGPISPAVFGSGCHVVYSVSESISIPADTHQLHVDGLEPHERRSLAGSLVSRFGKRLSTEALDAIENAPEAASPRFLTMVLNELRIYGDHALIIERLRLYLRCKTMVELFDCVLVRLEADYDRDRPFLVKDALAFIWASRHGIAEQDLLSLLGTSSEPLAAELWAPIRISLADSLRMTITGLEFAHSDIREAVRRRYLSATEDAIVYHRRIALHLIAGPGADQLGNATAHLLEQLDAGECWAQLVSCLIQKYTVVSMWNKSHEHRDDVIAYWRHIEASSGFSIRTAYGDVIENPSVADPDLLAVVAELLWRTGAGGVVHDMTRDVAERGTREINNEIVPSRYSRLLAVAGEWRDVATQLRQQRTACERLGDHAKLARIILEQGHASLMQEEWAAGLEFYRNAREICDRFGLREELGQVLRCEARVLRYMGRVAEAEECEQLARHLVLQSLPLDDILSKQIPLN